MCTERTLPKRPGRRALTHPTHRDIRSTVSGKSIKVTDRRMFTLDGELRDDFRHLDQPAPAGDSDASDVASARDAPAAAAAKTTPAPAPDPASDPAPAPAGGQLPEDDPLSQFPEDLYGPYAPAFRDLLGLIAEPAAIYLGDVPEAGGARAQDLALAALHIRLLGVLREKTAGNLDFQDRAMLDDVLRQLRLRFVEKRGS